MSQTIQPLHPVKLVLNRLGFNFFTKNTLFIKKDYPVMALTIRLLQLKHHGYFWYPICWAAEYLARLVQFRSFKQALRHHQFEVEVYSAMKDSTNHRSAYKIFFANNVSLNLNGERILMLNEIMTLGHVLAEQGLVSEEEYNNKVAEEEAETNRILEQLDEEQSKEDI